MLYVMISKGNYIYTYTVQFIKYKDMGKRLFSY